MEKKKQSNWSEVIYLERDPRFETLVPKCTLVTHHSLLPPPQGPGVYWINLEHREFLLPKQRRSSLLVRMCDIPGHRELSHFWVTVSGPWGAVKRGSCAGRWEKLNVLFFQEREQWNPRDVDYWTNSRRECVLAKRWFLEATVHSWAIPFPSRILLSVLDKDVCRLWITGRLHSFIHIWNSPEIC